MIETPFLAINSEADAPSCYCVVVVHAIDRGRALIEYVSLDVRSNPKWRKPFWTDPGVLTPVADFDVELGLTHRRINWELYPKRIGTSKAKYKDGKSRRWQGDSRDIYVESSMVPFIERALRGAH